MNSIPQLGGRLSRNASPAYKSNGLSATSTVIWVPDGKLTTMDWGPWPVDMKAARHQQGERQGDEDANPSRLSLLHRCTTTGYTRDLIVQLDRREPPPATTGEAQR